MPIMRRAIRLRSKPRGLLVCGGQRPGRDRRRSENKISGLPLPVMSARRGGKTRDDRLLPKRSHRDHSRSRPCRYAKFSRRDVRFLRRSWNPFETNRYECEDRLENCKYRNGKAKENMKIKVRFTLTTRLFCFQTECSLHFPGALELRKALPINSSEI